MRCLRAVLPVSVIVAATHVVSADEIYWQAGAGDWFNASNWSDQNNGMNQVPGGADDAYIENGGAAQISGAAAASNLTSDGGEVDVLGGSLTVANAEYVGNSGNGLLNQSGGTNTTSGWGLYLGDNSGSTGTYSLSDTGSLSVGGGALDNPWDGNEIVGNSGTGNFIQSGGSNSCSSILLASQAGSTGTYWLSSGSLSVELGEGVGGNGTGIFNQSGGTNTVASCGLSIGSYGTYNLSGKALLSDVCTVESEIVDGTFNQTGGTHAVSGNGGLQVGFESTGIYTLSGAGSLSVSGYECIGYFDAYFGPGSAAGTFIQSGGTHTVDGTLMLGDRHFICESLRSQGFDQADFTGTATGLSTSDSDVASGTYSLSGTGSLSVSGDEYIGYFDGFPYGQASAAGIFTQSGGTHTVGGTLSLVVSSYPCESQPSQGFDQADFKGTATSLSNSNSDTGLSGTYNLLGGTLTAEAINVNAGGTFTQTGGASRVTGTLTVAGNAVSSGSYNLSGGTLTAGAIVVNSGGSFFIQGPAATTTLTTGSFTNSGTLLGNGTISGKVSNSGVIAPGGTDPGTLTINGDYSQNPSGALNIRVNGTSTSGNFDSLAISGAASLNGSLKVTLGNTGGTDFIPAYADSFKILSAGSLTGTFNNYDPVVEAKFSSNSNAANNNSAGLFNVTYADNLVTLSDFHQVDYFGIGVDWSTVKNKNGSPNTNLNNVQGNKDVTNLGNALFHQTSEVVDVNASNPGAANLAVINTDFGQFASHFDAGVGANDIIVFALSSHGANGQFGISADGTDNLTTTSIATDINSLPSTAQKIVIVDCCDSAAFGSALEGIPNTAVLTATSGMGPATGTPGKPGYDPNGDTSTKSDGTGVFSDAIENELNEGVYDISEIASDLGGSGYYGNLIGQNLYLKDSGSAIFGGEEPGLYKNSTFDSELFGAPISNLTWNNAGGASPNDGQTWDIANNCNWNNGSAATVYTDGSNLTFNDFNNGNYAVTLNTTVSPGSVTVNNSSGNYAFSGTGSITGNGSLTKTGSATLTLNTVNTYTGGTIVNAGTLIVGVDGALPNSNVIITGGTLQLGASTGLVQMTSLSITGTGVLDVNNNHVIITYGSSDPITTIAGYIKSGYNGGAWNGTGIMSTAAQTPTNGLLYGLGYADGADNVVAGLSSGQIEVMYTLLGDANLDGLVNGSDFNILAANFNQSVTGWDEGDFNYDGLVNGADFLDLAANFNQGASGAATAGDVAALDAFAAANGLLADVPEPECAGMMVMAGFGILRRRRRSARCPLLSSC
jgi:autotransporter-associated beta strand protein